MERYEKTVVEVNGELAEGVYAASGAAGSNVLGCDSQYMNGI